MPQGDRRAVHAEGPLARSTLTHRHKVHGGNTAVRGTDVRRRPPGQDARCSGFLWGRRSTCEHVDDDCAPADEQINEHRPLHMLVFKHLVLGVRNQSVRVENQVGHISRGDDCPRGSLLGRAEGSVDPVARRVDPIAAPPLGALVVTASCSVSSSGCHSWGKWMSRTRSSRWVNRASIIGRRRLLVTLPQLNVARQRTVVRSTLNHRRAEHAEPPSCGAR